jgi:hypothetical protein
MKRRFWLSSARNRCGSEKSAWNNFPPLCRSAWINVRVIRGERITSKYSVSHYVPLLFHGLAGAGRVTTIFRASGYQTPANVHVRVREMLDNAMGY